MSADRSLNLEGNEVAVVKKEKCLQI